MKQIHFKKSSSFLIVFVLFAFASFHLSFTHEASKTRNAGNMNISVRNDASFASEPSGSGKYVKKDESVYFTLKQNGDTDMISIVNHLQTPVSGEYTDYGEYTSIRSLSLKTEPLIDNGRIIWTLPASDQGFYYQGSAKNLKPPFLIGIDYYLDGKLTAAKDLVGKSGRIKIVLKVDANPDMPAYFKENYLCQMQFPVSMDMAKNIKAPDAQIVISGKTSTLSYVVLPGKSKSFIIEFDTGAFEMDAITIVSIPFSAKNYIGADSSSIEKGIAQLLQGAETLTDGSKKLKNGMETLSGAFGTLAASSNKINAGLKNLDTGFISYQKGIETLSKNLGELSGGLSSLSENSAGLKQGFSDLSDGIEEMATSLQPLLLMLPAEQQAIYAQKINTLLAGLSEYETSLNAYLDSIAMISHSAEQLADGMDSLAMNGGVIKSGMNESYNGFVLFADGISALNSRVASLPNQVEKLIEGQSKLSSGIRESSKMLDSFSFDETSQDPVSFADPSVKVDSVQFFMTVPAQSMSVYVTPINTGNDNKSFLQKLIDLFK